MPQANSHKNLLEFRQQIGDLAWFRFDGDDLLELKRGIEDTSFLRFTASEVTAIDGRLTKACRVLSQLKSASHRWPGYDVIDGELLRLTIDYWNKPLHLRTEDGHVLPYTNIWTIHLTSKNKVLADVYQLEVLKVRKWLRTEFEVVKTRYLITTELSQDWLNTAYPGWFERYNVALNMDLDGTEMASYVFSSVTDNLRPQSNALPFDIT